MPLQKCLWYSLYIDVDECKESSTTSLCGNATCINMKPFFNCTCQPGYYLDTSLSAGAVRNSTNLFCSGNNSTISLFFISTHFPKINNDFILITLIIIFHNVYDFFLLQLLIYIMIIVWKFLWRPLIYLCLKSSIKHTMCIQVWYTCTHTHSHTHIHSHTFTHIKFICTYIHKYWW